MATFSIVMCRELQQGWCWDIGRVVKIHCVARRGLKGEPLLARGGEEAMVQGNISTGGWVGGKDGITMESWNRGRVISEFERGLKGEDYYAHRRQRHTHHKLFKLLNIKQGRKGDKKVEFEQMERPSLSTIIMVGEGGSIDSGGQFSEAASHCCSK